MWQYDAMLYLGGKETGEFCDVLAISDNSQKHIGHMLLFMFDV
jgi:hypothetical protein